MTIKGVRMGERSHIRITIEDEAGQLWVLPPQAAITRVAPAEWPPQPGDIWLDRQGWEWVGLHVNDQYVRLQQADDAGARSFQADEALTTFGPMTLLRRRNWSPAPVVEPVEVELDERAEMVAGLQQLADLIESHTAIPLPQNIHAQYSVLNLGRGAEGNVARVAEVERIAQLLDVEMTDEQTAKLVLRGGVEFVVHTYLDRATEPTAALEPVAEPAQPVDDERSAESEQRIRDAVSALRVLAREPGIGREGSAYLLQTWHRYGELTPSERERVLGLVLTPAAEVEPDATKWAVRYGRFVDPYPTKEDAYAARGDGDGTVVTRTGPDQSWEVAS